MVGGARLALATRFEPEVFWTDVRRYGATVVFYAGEMLRALVNAPPEPGERTRPLRLFAGSGMRARRVARSSCDRFGSVGVLEFYASTEGTLVLANAAGEKVGALGRPLPGSTDMDLAVYDFDLDDFTRDSLGRLVRAGVDEPGVLVARVDSAHSSDLLEQLESESSTRIRRDAFDTGDAWFVTGDLLRRDADGDYWFVDRLRDLVRTADGVVPTRPIEDALYDVPGVALAVAYGLKLPGALFDIPVAAVVTKAREPLDLEPLRAGVRPRFIRVVERIPMTDGYRLLKAPLRAQGIAADGHTLWFDPERDRYVPLDAALYETAIRAPA